MKIMNQDLSKRLLTFLLVIGMLCATSVAFAADYSVIAAGTESYSFNVSIPVDEAEAYAGIQFGLTLSSESSLKLNSFTLSSATSSATKYPENTKNGVHYFGFLTTASKNVFQGKTTVGTLNFTYTGTAPQVITITEMSVFRINGMSVKRSDKTSPVYVIYVSRGAVSSGDLELDILEDELPLSASPFNNPFEDVFAEDWFYDSVGFAYMNGLMLGTNTEPMLFSPYENVSRAMAVTVLYRHAGSPDVSGLSMPFDDTLADTWYTDAIKWGAQNDIILGFGDGTFKPDAPVTREQIAAIIYRYEEFVGIVLPDVAEDKVFADQSHIESWATGAVQAMVRQGMMIGKLNDMFDPQSPTIRAEFATLLHRFVLALEPVEAEIVPEISLLGDD